MRHVWAGGTTSSRKHFKSSFHQRLAAVCMSLILAGAPVTGALAGDGFTTVQFELGLGKTVELRQVNLAFQSDIGPTQGFTSERLGQNGVAIPLYSVNPRMPGLLNYLNASDAKPQGTSKVTVGTVLGVVAGIGLLGLLAYGLGKCFKRTSKFHLDGTKQNDKACKSASSGLGKLGGLS